MGNRIIILDEIVKELSELTNTTPVLSESFIKALFNEVAGQLACDGKAEVPAVGKFYIENDDVKFTVDSELDSCLNSAFESFEPVVLDDDFNFDEDIPQTEPNQNDVSVEIEPERESEVITEDERPEELEQASKEQTIVAPEPTESENETPSDEDTTEDGNEEESPSDLVGEEQLSEQGEEPNDAADVLDVQDDAPVSKSFFDKRFWVGILIGVFVCTVIFFVWSYFNSVNSLAGDESLIAQSDTAVVKGGKMEIQQDTASIKVVDNSECKDTLQYKDQYFKVTTAAYLSNVSRKYYDHYAFWIYIYLENKDVIKDPDNIPIGLTLKIPDPKRYGIDKNDPNSIKRAQIKALEYTNDK